MADIIVVAADVILQTGALDASKFSSGAVSLGYAVTLSTGQQWVAAQANGDAVLAGSGGVAIALNTNAATGQPLTVAASGATIAFGSGVLSPGETYVISAIAAGGIAPIGDLGVGNFTTILGYASDDSILVVSLLVVPLVRS